VLEEAGVFDGQHGIVHDLGDLGDGRERAPLFAKFAQQGALGRVDAQGSLGR
jgi:hypothetical protein